MSDLKNQRDIAKLRKQVDGLTASLRDTQASMISLSASVQGLLGQTDDHLQDLASRVTKEVKDQLVWQNLAYEIDELNSHLENQPLEGTTNEQ